MFIFLRDFSVNSHTSIHVKIARQIREKPDEEKLHFQPSLLCLISVLNILCSTNEAGKELEEGGERLYICESGQFRKPFEKTLSSVRVCQSSVRKKEKRKKIRGFPEKIR